MGGDRLGVSDPDSASPRADAAPLLASDLLETALPKEVLRRVQADPVVKSLAAQVRERIFRAANVPPGILEMISFYLRAMESLGDRVRYCFDLVMIPSPLEWALLPLPAWLFPLYYVLRPLRLAKKYGCGLLKHAPLDLTATERSHDGSG